MVRARLTHDMFAILTCTDLICHLIDAKQNYSIYLPTTSSVYKLKFAKVSSGAIASHCCPLPMMNAW